MFVAGSTARVAGESVGVKANTSASFFMRLRQLIASKQPSFQALNAQEKLRQMKATLVVFVRGSEVRGAAGKVAVFGLLKRGGKVYTCVILMLEQKPYCLLLKRKLLLIVLCIPILLEPTMYWIYRTFIIGGLLTQSCLLTNTITSIVLRTFGTKRSDI